MHQEEPGRPCQGVTLSQDIPREQKKGLTKAVCNLGIGMATHPGVRQPNNVIPPILAHR